MHVTTLLGAGCLLLAGCGGSSPSHSASVPQALPSYVTAGNAICAAQLAQINKLAQPTTPEGAVSYLPKVVALMRSETTQLAALDPTGTARAKFAAGLASSRQLASYLSHFLHQMQAGVVEISAFSQVQGHSEAMKAATEADFRGAGLAGCAG